MRLWGKARNPQKTNKSLAISGFSFVLLTRTMRVMAGEDVGVSMQPWQRPLAGVQYETWDRLCTKCMISDQRVLSLILQCLWRCGEKNPDPRTCLIMLNGTAKELIIFLLTPFHNLRWESKQGQFQQDPFFYLLIINIINAQCWSPQGTTDCIQATK